MKFRPTKGGTESSERHCLVVRSCRVLSVFWNPVPLRSAGTQPCPQLITRQKYLVSVGTQNRKGGKATNGIETMKGVNKCFILEKRKSESEGNSQDSEPENSQDWVVKRNRNCLELNFRLCEQNL